MTGFNYFGNKSWADITREERYFCSHMYHSLLGKEKEFVKWLSNQTKTEIDFNKDWNINFEVCFYRDFLKSHNQSVKIYQRKTGGYYSQKRTFDLCLFSLDEMIIIEAKAKQGFTGKQLDEIIEDKKDVEALTEEFSMDKKVRVILLHSSLYHPTDPRILNFPRFTWSDYSAFENTNKNIFIRADKVYKEDSTD